MWVANRGYPCCNGPCIEFNWKTIFAVMRKGLVRIYYALVVGLCVLLAGCGEPALKPGQNWVPKVIGGPIEVRPLPLATELAEDYGKWIRESNSKKLRVYEDVPFARLQIIAIEGIEQTGYRGAVEETKCTLEVMSIHDRC